MTNFDSLRHQAEKEWNALRNSQKPLILIGTATCGRSAGSMEVLRTFQRELQNCGLNCNIVEVGCIGLCYAEPIVCIFKPSRPGICYGEVTPERAKELIERYLITDYYS